LVVLLAPSGVGRAQAQTVNAAGSTVEWPSYGGDKAGSKYSPLAQIGPANFDRLRVAWPIEP